MAKRDYYEILGIPRDADRDSIRKAYRSLARKYHPDRNPDNPQAAERFKEISEAHAVLSDPEKRRQYDQLGSVGDMGGFDFSGFQQGDLGGLGDLFGQFFSGGATGGGRGGRRGGPRRGDDLVFELEIPFATAVRGGRNTIRINHRERCEPCKGTGSSSGRTPPACSQCNGSGQVTVSQGFFAIPQTCSACRGQGRVISDPCSTCRGTGAVSQEREITFRIPPGVDSGKRIRLAGQGHVGSGGGPAGDLIIELRVAPHPTLQREGRNLRTRLTIDLATALLGGKRPVRGVDRDVTLKIPPGVQPGQKLRLRGQGIAPPHGGPGDLIVEIQVELPRKLSSAQRKKLTTALEEAGLAPPTS